MKRRTVKILMKMLLWLINHIVVQTKNLNENKDCFRENDDTRPVESTEIKFKWDF